ncbi:alpha/beta fold hydrolase [Pseudomonas sp. UL073]|uniref:Alpha/beta fold hydrolase n=1 Tax=Zestomonas insulae TaxID=2809017 RepID=A0ABS2IE72_9GAMM|nr:alpha/beta fold hydrolase [Pseudomonas insulae]MBM7061391.1 alpha/beta fold hydrolase [Pseudomonas insulae]
MRYRTDYQPSLLTEPPMVLRLGAWNLHYLAFSRAADDRRPPVLLLGGAFQCFRSFASEVAELLADHPVILLDLPSQGGNLQLAPELDLNGLADLIAAFAEALELPPLQPIGLSYGSALAALFAVRHPQRCARLLLAGITAFGRPGARRLLEESLALLDEDRLGEFAQGALTGLINPLHVNETGVSPVFRKALLRQLQRLGVEEIERYRQNSQRLLGFSGFARHPECPTLVLAGEHDHFTQPWEHAQFAAACAQADCALIHGADHLAQFERRSACAALYTPFLRGAELPPSSPGSTRLAHSQLGHLERRQEARLAPRNRRAQLRHATAGEWSAELAELGFFGCLLRGELPAGLPRRDWWLLSDELPAQPLLLLRQDHDELAGVFPHTDAQASAALAAQVGEARLPEAACA